jgi:hypothetical protein
MRFRRLVVPVLTTTALSLLAGCGSSTSASTSAGAQPSAAARPSTSAQPSAADPQTLSLVEAPISTTFTPKGGVTTPGQPARQPGPGDTVAFDATLTRAGASAGHDHVSFTYRSGGQALVQATLTLTDGTIVVRGTTPLTDSLTLPVESGTGAYAGRTGSLTAKHVNQQEDDLTVVLR